MSLTKQQDESRNKLAIVEAFTYGKYFLLHKNPMMSMTIHLMTSWCKLVIGGQKTTLHFKGTAKTTSRPLNVLNKDCKKSLNDLGYPFRHPFFSFFTQSRRPQTDLKHISLMSQRIGRENVMIRCS